MPEEEYFYSGDWQRWNVPAGVDVVDVVLRGAGSGSVKGGRVTGKLRVDGSQVLFIRVGHEGQPASGSNGGNDQGSSGGGGSGKGGNGGPGKLGGWSGGASSLIRVNSPDGAIRAVAGGAGGRSGDGGQGGEGGASTGQHGSPGTAGPGTPGNSTGGTQTQGGRGGNNSLGGSFQGKDAANPRLDRAGAGAGPGTAGTWGGGGGGGGLHGGGGGQAAARMEPPRAAAVPVGRTSPEVSTTPPPSVAAAPSTTATSRSPGKAPRATRRPPPTNSPSTATPSPTGCRRSPPAQSSSGATRTAPTVAPTCGCWFAVSQASNFSEWRRFRGTFDPGDGKDRVDITGLSQDTGYWLRVHTQDSHGVISNEYSSTNFWTNRQPAAAIHISPVENQEYSELDNVTFVWNHVDPDPSDSQTGFRLKWRRAATPVRGAGSWSPVIEQITDEETYTISNIFPGNSSFEWAVKTRDEQNRWGIWSNSTSYYVVADTTPPILLEPINNEAFIAAEEKRFRWKFMGPQNRVHQTRLDIRYRAAYGDGDWTTLFGAVNPGQPGTNQFWDIPAETFAANVRYEWQAMSYSSLGSESDWSASAFFWTVDAPGSGAGIEITDSGRPQDPLGQGNNRAFVYDRGGNVLRGEITPLVDITWSRVRDDISKVTLHLTEWDRTSREFLRTLRTWTHEIVVFREVNGKSTRVWEGPITRISGNQESLEVEAWDVMAYVYRRIMRQGYNDAYRVVNGVQLGLKTVVQRSQQIIMNALAYDDPNILAYLTPLNNVGDALTLADPPRLLPHRLGGGRRPRCPGGSGLHDLRSPDHPVGHPPSHRSPTGDAGRGLHQASGHHRVRDERGQLLRGHQRHRYLGCRRPVHPDQRVPHQGSRRRGVH